ncbi:hypothetical protein KR51_00027880 [Rubidibacter lacunae KORDI 51-2]|uniref:Tc1-like transposase DDE domain-containing protein n=1 Tax=Rubidibacter lacunae KORDI 51-2 TaxID=582515 RepID=U5D843_9CHRO|nr:transposase [Rubidibacter lacunae]ERN40798.1 hypothetical protein KR51_00027880 [Rubidibacter lacunae KORDI 51-2]
MALAKNLLGFPNRSRSYDFLKEFAAAYPRDLHVMQVDGARAHRAGELQVPENVILMFQPAYSPQENPMELCWEWLKSGLKWLNCSHLEELREKLRKPCSWRDGTSSPQYRVALAHRPAIRVRTLRNWYQYIVHSRLHQLANLLVPSAEYLGYAETEQGFALHVLTDEGDRQCLVVDLQGNPICRGPVHQTSPFRLFSGVMY